MSFKVNVPSRAVEDFASLYVRSTVNVSRLEALEISSEEALAPVKTTVVRSARPSATAVSSPKTTAPAISAEIVAVVSLEHPSTFKERNFPASVNVSTLILSLRTIAGPVTSAGTSGSAIPVKLITSKSAPSVPALAYLLAVKFSTPALAFIVPSNPFTTTVGTSVKFNVPSSQVSIVTAVGPVIESVLFVWSPLPS